MQACGRRSGDPGGPQTVAAAGRGCPDRASCHTCGPGRNPDLMSRVAILLAVTGERPSVLDRAAGRVASEAGAELIVVPPVRDGWDDWSRRASIFRLTRQS